MIAGPWPWPCGRRSGECMEASEIGSRKSSGALSMVGQSRLFPSRQNGDIFFGLRDREDAFHPGVKEDFSHRGAGLKHDEFPAGRGQEFVGVDEQAHPEGGDKSDEGQIDDHGPRMSGYGGEERGLDFLNLGEIEASFEGEGGPVGRGVDVAKVHRFAGKSRVTKE